jgi:hypothetical protein
MLFLVPSPSNVTRLNQKAEVDGEHITQKRGEEHIRISRMKKEWNDIKWEPRRWVENNIKMGIHWTGVVPGFCDNMIRDLLRLSAGRTYFPLISL